MTDIVIRVQDISKCYKIYNTPGDRLKQFIIPKLFRVPVLRKLFTPSNSSPLTFYKEFWALTDVSIEIKKGEAKEVLKQIIDYVKIKPNERFDFVFLDADKELNIEYFDLILPMIKVGGIIATDNILYPERFRPLMKKYVEHIKTKSNVQTVSLDLGNGEQITIKTS